MFEDGDTIKDIKSRVKGEKNKKFFIVVNTIGTVNFFCYFDIKGKYDGFDMSVKEESYKYTRMILVEKKFKETEKFNYV